MPFNYNKFVKLAHNLITKFGTQCALRRSGIPDRQITAVFDRYRSDERIGRLENPLDETVLVDPTNLTIWPDQELDTLITYQRDSSGALLTPLTVDQVYRIVKPPSREAPGGIIIYWELTVRGPQGI